MNRTTLIATVAAGALIAGSVGVWLGRTAFDPHNEEAPVHAEDGDGHAEAGGHADEAGHEEGAPEGTKDEHDDEEKAAGDEVEITPEQIEASGIVVAPAQAGALSGGILAQGSIIASPDGFAVLSARSTGTVSAISKRLGDPVARGDVLARIQSSEGGALAAALVTAESRAQVARSAFEREKKLFESEITSRQDFEAAQDALTGAEAELKSAKSAMSAAGLSGDGQFVLVKSPIAGRVTRASAVLGTYVDAGTELFQIADPKKVHVEAALPSADASAVKPGDIAKIILADETLDGVVRSVTPGLDADSRTATAIIDLKINGTAMQPGQFARVRIAARSVSGTAQGVVVPDEAVQSFEGSDAVFVRTEHGFEARPVVTGGRSGGQVEILSGLKAGEAIATVNAFLVKSELGKSEASHEH